MIPNYTIKYKWQTYRNAKWLPENSENVPEKNVVFQRTLEGIIAWKFTGVFLMHEGWVAKL